MNEQGGFGVIIHKMVKHVKGPSFFNIIILMIIMCHYFLNIVLLIFLDQWQSQELQVPFFDDNIHL